MKDEKDKGEGQTGMPAKNPAKVSSKDPRKDSSKDSSKDPRKDPRQDRLKLALRENLKRRKSQARGRGDAAAVPSNGDDGSPHDGSGKKPGQ